MNPGDVVYLKSGGPAMTLVRRDGEDWFLNWMGGATLYSGVFPEAALVEANPEPAISKATAALRAEAEAGPAIDSK